MTIAELEKRIEFLEKELAKSHQAEDDANEVIADLERQLLDADCTITSLSDELDDVKNEKEKLEENINFDGLAFIQNASYSKVVEIDCNTKVGLYVAGSCSVVMEQYFDRTAEILKSIF